MNKESPDKVKISDRKAVLTSFQVDIIDVLLNGATALITGSVVMLAETLQGISDLTVDVLVYTGMKRSKRPATKRYPLGFGRELFVWSLFAILIMFFVLAGLSFYFGFQRFLDPKPIEYIYLAYLVLIISLVTNGYSFSLSARRILSGRSFWKVRKAFSESTFLETKITFTSDMLGFLSAGFGLVALILFERTDHAWFDGLGGMMIALLMAGFSFWLLRNVRDFIIGVSAPVETQRKIEEAALEISGVKEVLDLKAVVIGSNRLLVNIEIHVKDGLVTDEIERLIDKVKENVKEEIPSVHHIQVELETPSDELKV